MMKEIVPACFVVCLFVSMPTINSFAGLPVGAAERANNARKTLPFNWTSPNVNALPNNAWGRTVRYGRDLFIRTSSFIGPEVKDPRRRASGNSLDCQSCHIQGGTKQRGLPLIGVYARFPTYSARAGKVGTIEERINGCLERSMNGQRLTSDSPEMVALVSYLKFLSIGFPIGKSLPSRDTDSLVLLSRPASPGRGSAIYKMKCEACHNLDGRGRRVGKIGDTKGFAVPPLWGRDSFNDGAGMARLTTAATFIHDNMPDGTTWLSPTLSPKDSWDVAAYIESKPRPHKAGLDHDFPNRFEKPADTAYGPYEDKFTSAQHKYGPFSPIVEAHKKR